MTFAPSIAILSLNVREKNERFEAKIQSEAPAIAEVLLLA